MPWLVYVCRLAVLAGERVAFHRLGRRTPPLAVALVAYGGGALVLLPAAVVAPGPWVDRAAALPGVVYAGSFLLYTWSLAIGPLAVVAPWPAVTTLFLWIASPDGGVLGFSAVAAVMAGGFLLVGGEVRARSRAVGLMLVSDALLAAARLLDQGRTPASPLAYAFTVYLTVTVLFTLTAVLGRMGCESVRLVARDPGWAFVAAVSNGAAYVTVVVLLRWWPAYLVEALSAGAGVVTTGVAVAWLGERASPTQVAGAALMTAGAAALALLQGRLG
jgi:drug/metabolite transporter (DMT)-like permease